MRHHAINISLASLSCVYAHWLRDHKRAEPDLTFAEVIFGVGYTLAGAHLHNRITRGNWRQTEAHIFEAFCYSAPPIVIGELWQAWQAYQERKAFQARQEHEELISQYEVKYEDLTQ